MQPHSTITGDTEKPRPWLRRFCYLTILATFSLIAVGGHVTSTDVGLAVPDGLTTFGYPTLIAPLEVWWYDFGTRWEHSHRLKGNLVGMMSIVMAVWLFRTQKQRKLLKWAGVVLLIAVCIQGLMGAFRVSELSLTLAFIHGIFGQLILCGWVVIAAALSGPWLSRLKAITQRQREKQTPRLRWAVRILLVLLLAQLTLGSAVRHFKADKAIPDFPLTYGQVLPPMSQESLDTAYADYYANQLGKTPEEAGISNRTPQGETVVALNKVDLQFAHRFGAVVVCTVGLIVIVGAFRKAADKRVVFGPAMILLTLLTAQFALGVITVATGTDPIMATLHQATGAALIAVATWLAVRIHLAEYPAIEPALETVPRPTIAEQPATSRTTPATA